jgi:hypothetical protein
MTKKRKPSLLGARKLVKDGEALGRRLMVTTELKLSLSPLQAALLRLPVAKDSK